MPTADFYEFRPRSKQPEDCLAALNISDKMTYLDFRDEPCGFLPLWKPRGMSSKDASRRIERQFGRKFKIGHVGTLDPMAEGVLPLLFGRASKLQDLFLATPKVYEFDLDLGCQTDTLDSEGVVVREEKGVCPDLETVNQVCTEFLGKIQQIPPVYSAVKFKGKPLYEYARSEKIEDLPDMEKFTRDVELYEITCTKIESISSEEPAGSQDFPIFARISFRTRCSKGTYVRSLGRDIAARLGTVGFLSRIVRMESAGIVKEDCVDLSEVLASGGIHEILSPVSQLPLEWPSWTSGAEGLSQRVLTGQTVLVKKEHFFEDCVGLQYQGGTSFNGIRSCFFFDEKQRYLGVGCVEQVEDDNFLGIILKRRV